MPTLNSHHPSRDMRFMPDFVVTSAKSGDLFYLEVKFRANGCFEFDEKYADYPYKNPCGICREDSVHALQTSQGRICHHSRHALPDYRLKSFHISKESVAEYEGYAKEFFAAFNRLKAEG